MHIGGTDCFYRYFLFASVLGACSSCCCGCFQSAKGVVRLAFLGLRFKNVVSISQLKDTGIRPAMYTLVCLKFQFVHFNFYGY
jgi:hypothetical protein